MGIYVFEQAIFDAIKRTEPGYKGEYQLTDSVKLFAKEGKLVIFKLINGIHIDVGTPSKIKYMETQKGDVRDTLADIDSTKEALHWTPQVNIKEGLIRYIHWFRDNQ